MDLVSKGSSVDASVSLQKLFLALPALTSVVYLPFLLRPSSSRDFLTASLGLTSLAADGYTLTYLPLPIWQALKATGSPIKRYLVPLNALLCGFVLLLSWGGTSRGEEENFYLKFAPTSRFPFPGLTGIFTTR